MPLYTPTAVKLSDTKLAADTANFDLQNIPGGYSALQIIARLRSDRAAQVNDAVRLVINNDTAANYDYENSTWAGGAASGSSALLAAGTNILLAKCPAATAPASVFGAHVIFIPGYDDTVGQKSAVGTVHWKDGVAATSIVSGTFGFDWRSTAAITRLTFSPNAGTVFIAGSRIILFGLP